MKQPNLVSAAALFLLSAVLIAFGALTAGAILLGLGAIAMAVLPGRK